MPSRRRPDRCRSHRRSAYPPVRPVGPAGARWDDGLAEFILPYEVVRRADDPDATLLEFLQSTYEAAATAARWDRAELDRSDDPDEPLRVYADLAGHPFCVFVG